MTTAPAYKLSFDEALVLYGARWQIELLFKLWKSHAKLETSIRCHPWRILTEISIKMLAGLVQHWIILMGCWNHPNRSLVKAAQVILSQCQFDCNQLHIESKKIGSIWYYYTLS
ncbi:transposase, IS4 family [Beggiatoa sp. PS]|nr:transposase, IS4 family [Beggiatoa sp. PS]